MAELAEEFGWPLVYQQARDQAGGVDGQMIWLSDSGVSVHYIIDAVAGIGYLTMAGPDTESVSPFVSRATTALSPWQLEDLFQKFQRESDPIERGRLALRTGLAAPPEATDGCIQVIMSALADDDARVRLAGLWSVTYTGYGEFVEAVQRIAHEDPESMIRARAESVVRAFSVVVGEE